METREKLIVQILETKNRIIEQVKHQTQLYNKHLASKALLHGLTPPSWLFSPSNSLPKELSKEDLISEVLHHGPPARPPPVRYSVAGSSSQYSRPFVSDFGEVADGFGMEAHASNKDRNDVVEGQSTIVEGHECIAQNNSNYLPEVDVSSPVDFVDVRISNVYTDPNLSLARIQRSKSRQKALEQRNSATSQPKRNSVNEGTPRASTGNRLFALDDQQTGHSNSSSILSEPCAISGAKQSTCYLRNENNTGAHSNEIKLTAFEPHQVHSVIEPSKSAEPLSISSEGCVVKGKSETDNENLGEGYNDHGRPQVMLHFSDNVDKAEQLEFVNKNEAIEPGNVKIAENFHVSGKDQRREKSVGNSCSPFPNAAADIPGDSFTISKAGYSGVQMAKSEPRRSLHYELEESQNNGQHSSSNEAASTQSNPLTTNDDVKFYSEQGCKLSSELLLEERSAGEKSKYEDSQVKSASGDHVMLLFSDMCDKAEQLEPVNNIEAIKPGTVNLAETSVSEDDALREKSLSKSCSPFPDAEAYLPRDSITTNNAGNSGVQMTKSEPSSGYLAVWHCELEARKHSGQHSSLIKAASTQSIPLNSIYDVKFSPEQGCGSSSELLVEELGVKSVDVIRRHLKKYEELNWVLATLSGCRDIPCTFKKYNFQNRLTLREKCYPTKNDENIVNHSQKKSEASILSRWTEKAAESTLGGLFEVTTPSYMNSVYATNHEDEQRSDYPLGIANLSCSEKISSEGRLSLQVDGRQPQHSDPSSRNKDLELMIDDWGYLPKSFKEEGYSKRKSVAGEDDILSHSVQSPHMEELSAEDADQSLPELESFLVDSQSEDDTLGFPGHMINLDNFELPRSTIARVSMLERLCKSASAYTPLSHLSSAFKMDKASDLVHSMPNGLLEHTDIGGVHFRNEVDEFRVSLSTPGEAEGGLQGVPPTTSLPYSDAPIGFPSVNGFSSPEGRFWEGYSSRSNSSGKRLSSNPEFECFTIKEDPCISEGNESADDDCDKLSKDVDSVIVNCHAIDSDKFLEDGDSLTMPCAAREPSTGIHNKFKSFLRSSHNKKVMGKDSQTPLLASGKRMAKDSLNNRYKKLKTTGNERLNRAREPYGSNIVSNVTSFIPLVQQKQAAAKACTGKREIKVKALEAAEAAKRLEEKRENERNLKKEALKKERARTMEQEKAKQIEVMKKKKEDEQRRRDADMVLRKRLREEEERKEERKRTRIEETRRKQRDQEEKLQAKKAGNMDSKKKSNHELKPQQMKKTVEHVKLDNKSRSAATSSSNIQQASTHPNLGSYSADLCDIKQANCTPDKAKTSYFNGDNIQEKSYEISPFQCSDDEDDEEDELHTKKFIPSWASKNLVAESLSLMRDVDPNVIFPPESRCSMDEVLLPRALQQVQSML